MPKKPTGRRTPPVEAKAKASASKQTHGSQRETLTAWHAGYFAALAESGVYSWAATAAGVVLSTVWRERQRNPEFAAAEQESIKTASMLLEGEAVRRAIHGLRKYKFTAQGEPVLDPRTGEQYFELEFSDALLQTLLKGRLPDVFRDKIEQSGSLSVTHQHLTLEELKKRLEDARK